MIEDKVLDAAEAAKFLKISRKQLIMIAKTQDLPHLRLGRAYMFTQGSLSNWINKRLHCSHPQ